ncbi:MAG: MBL fold metallo-hydrolase [Micropepsaceae bacterium]
MRIFLWIVGGLAVLAAIGYLALANVPQVQDAVFDRFVSSAIGQMREDLFTDDALRVFVCGSSSPMPDPVRAKACIGVIAGGKVYFVDTGPQSYSKVALFRIPVNHIGGIFYTHFHSDHIADLGEFNMNSWILGREKTLDVYGPEGVERLVAGFSEAYALDQGYRTAHHGVAVASPDLWKMVPHTLLMQGEDPTALRNRTMVALEDGDLKVTAIEVKHDPVAPSYGYRFDYKGRSIVISGDTAKHMPLAVAAQGADVLFHEAQAQHMVMRMHDIAVEKQNARLAKIFSDIQGYHSSGIEAAEIANAAKVKLLVLYHFTPPVVNFVAERIYVRGIDEARDGDWLLSRDGTLIELPLNSKEVKQSSLN